MKYLTLILTVLIACSTSFAGEKKSLIPAKYQEMIALGDQALENLRGPVFTVADSKKLLAMGDEALDNLKAQTSSTPLQDYTVASVDPKTGKVNRSNVSAADVGSATAMLGK
jgi:hypothetical protein